jgi:predicted amidohydrolase
MKTAVIQMKVTDSKQRNLENAAERITAAAQQGADLVILHEIFRTGRRTELEHAV